MDLLNNGEKIETGIVVNKPIKKEKQYTNEWTNTSKAVKRIDLLNNQFVIYSSVKSASKENLVDPKDIRDCCNGKRKTAKGYRWEFYNE